MSEFEIILEECVDQIASGESTLEECLAYYPEYAAQLEPVLYTAASLTRAREVKPSPFLRAHIRSNLNRAMGDKPSQKRRPPFFFRRMALNMAVLTIALVMLNTLFAQGALPGETLYDWKLASESLWRTMTVDPLGTDLKLSDRRIHEYVALNDEERRAQVLLGYNKLLVRFKEEQDESDKTRILTVLKSHQDSLHKVGLAIPELDSYFSGGVTETNSEFQIQTPDAPSTRPTP
ncbi:MAG TPA: hypothetical protein VJ785_02235 [Anaerolineales bacterium]|nr:hypothetical protein [Anaerolineales bacterium]